MADAVRFVRTDGHDCSQRPTWRDPSPGRFDLGLRLRSNARQYLDVTFADPGGSGLDPGSITDPVRRVHAERVGRRARRSTAVRSAAARIATHSAAALRKAPLGGQLAGHRSEREPGRE